MLNAGNLALIAFARQLGNADGQIFALTVMVVAAAEAVLGLGLIVAVSRKRVELDVDRLTSLRGSDAGKPHPSPVRPRTRGIEVATGPIRILEAGAAEALRAAGHDVEVETVEVVEGDEEDYWNEIEGSFAVVRGVAGRVHGAIGRGSFPVVLAGNCLNSVGVVAGTSSDLGVVWFDAHGDFSTTEKSLSGFLDGMGLSILTGTGWEALRETVPGYRAVPEENVVHVGMRDAWDHEESGSSNQRSRSSRRPRSETGSHVRLDALRERVADVYLHLDLDVLDRSEGMVNIYAAEGGPSAADVSAAIQAIGDRFRIRAAAITAYDPGADPEGRVPPTAVRLLVGIVDAAADEDDEVVTALAWTALFSPAVAVVAIALLGDRIDRYTAGLLASGTTLFSFICTVAVFFDLLGREPEERSELSTAWTWLTAGDLRIGVEILIDPLSVFMMLVVSGVGFLILVYAIGYMHGDEEERRYHAYKALFVFSMLLLVMAGNLLLLLAGWGLVGLSSYLLINYWHQRRAPVEAGKKAFVMNAVGDATFVLALFILVQQVGSLDFPTVFAEAPEALGEESTLAVLVALGLLGGRRRQVGAGAAAHLAAGRDGGPDAG